MKTKIRPFLMFQGDAEPAMNFYLSLFPDSVITDIVRYGAESPGREGTVTRALLSLAGQEVICIDSPPIHKFTFTPSFSFFVDCVSAEQIRDLATRLGENGKILMPLENYGFSREYTWVSDRFGVSWQLNLA